MSRIDRFFAQANQLPALPEMAQRLLDCFRREDVSLVELSELIARDSALAARVLRLANSARYGTRRRVAHLPDAAALIGLNGLRGLALAAALVDVFPRPRGFDRQRFWRQNLATAGNPMAAEPFSPLGGVLRLASVLADAGEDGLDRVQAASVAQGGLMARLQLGPELLSVRLPAHELLVAPADEIPA
jgi:hypothetical protein